MLDFEPDKTAGARLRRIAMILIAAIVMAFGIAARADSVRLYDQVGVDGPVVTLNQVAELSGDAALAHGGVVLTTLKDGRSEHTITLDMIEKALDEAGVNWGLVSLRGFNTCKVTRLVEPQSLAPQAGQAVAANIETPIGLRTTLTLRGVVEQYINDNATVSQGDLRIEFTDRDTGKLDLPILGRSIEIEPVGINTLGRVPLTIRLYDEQRVAQTIQVSAKVQHVLLAVVADGPISRGDVFTRNHLKVRECLVDDDAIVPVTDPGMVIGQASATSLRAGEMVSFNKVKSPVMVKRGELVNVRCFIGGLVVRTADYAAEDGSLNDLIRLRSVSTGDEYYAVVTGDRQAVVSTSAGSQVMADTQQGSSP